MIKATLIFALLVLSAKCQAMNSGRNVFAECYAEMFSERLDGKIDADFRDHIYHLFNNSTKGHTYACNKNKTVKCHQIQNEGMEFLRSNQDLVPKQLRNPSFIFNTEAYTACLFCMRKDGQTKFNGNGEPIWRRLAVLKKDLKKLGY